MKTLDRLKEVEAIQVRGNGHGVVNGLLCSCVMERLRKRYCSNGSVWTNQESGH